MSDTLSSEARAIVDEEEALLARVLSTLSGTARTGRRDDREGLASQLRTLQDEASVAAPQDLPALFQQLTSVRALLQREETKPAPDPGTPYFAHLRLRTGTVSRDYLLGRTTFADTAAGVRIVDWRYAPIARIFYGYQEHDDFEEELPGGLTEGVVEVRRVLVVERGVVTRIVAGPRVLVRGADGWREDHAGILGGGAGTAARPGALGVGAEATARRSRVDITALLDPEQFEAVSASGERTLLVLGSAGSGKTTVALHRLARLAFDDPARFPRDLLRVIVPEEGLARLSRRLLAPLGLGSVQVETIDDWIQRSAREAFGLRELRVCEDHSTQVTRLKRHPALRDVLLRWFEGKGDGDTFPQLRKRLLETYSDRAFLDEVVAASGGELGPGVVDEVLRHTKHQLATSMKRETRGFHADSLRTADGRSIDDGTPDALSGTTDLEDLAILLFLRAQHESIVDTPLAHVVADEAEDLSLFELAVLGAQLGDARSCTLAGDEMQQTSASFAGWPEMLRTIGAANAATCRLQISYRCPKPIVELAQKVLGTQAPAAPARPGRDGVPVGFHRFPDEAQVQLFLADALRSLLDREPDASIGLVTSDPEAARSLFRAFDGMPGVRLVRDGEFTFEPGADVTDVDSVKGLEFDYVILPDATVRSYPQTPEARRRLHVAVTRASHQVWVVAAGTMTRLVER